MTTDTVIRQRLIDARNRVIVCLQLQITAYGCWRELRDRAAHDPRYTVMRDDAEGDLRATERVTRTAEAGLLDAQTAATCLINRTREVL